MGCESPEQAASDTIYLYTTYCYTCTGNVTNTSYRMSFAAITKLPFLHYHNLTLKKNLCCCCCTCICMFFFYIYMYMYMYLNVLSYLLLCVCTYMFHRGRVGNVFFDSFVCFNRSEERRVGEEWRSRWSTY